MSFKKISIVPVHQGELRAGVDTSLRTVSGGLADRRLVFGPAARVGHHAFIGLLPTRTGRGLARLPWRRYFCATQNGTQSSDYQRQGQATAKDSVTIPNQGRRVAFMKVSACFRWNGCTPSVSGRGHSAHARPQVRGHWKRPLKQGLSYSHQSGLWMGSRGRLQYYRARVSFAAAEFARYGVSCRHLGADAPA